MTSQSQTCMQANQTDRISFFRFFFESNTNQHNTGWATRGADCVVVT